MLVGVRVGRLRFGIEGMGVERLGVFGVGLCPRAGSGWSPKHVRCAEIGEHLRNSVGSSNDHDRTVVFWELDVLGGLASRGKLWPLLTCPVDHPLAPSRFAMDVAPILVGLRAGNGSSVTRDSQSWLGIDSDETRSATRRSLRDCDRCAPPGIPAVQKHMIALFLRLWRSPELRFGPDSSKLGSSIEGMAQGCILGERARTRQRYPPDGACAFALLVQPVRRMDEGSRWGATSSGVSSAPRSPKTSREAGEGMGDLPQPIRVSPDVPGHAAFGSSTLVQRPRLRKHCRHPDQGQWPVGLRRARALGLPSDGRPVSVGLDGDASR